ncbi:keratin-associated protein 20-2-like [Mesocricetus auratus]|uniref:Keratin-associated protein 20-2-like n=1 Tax=Mesocricetus auratus TaxID=10036 RepID=A0ABM2XUD4_MESAU|nr:keratin-associated protein 20-2-like [Mesocricetus auratus]
MCYYGGYYGGLGYGYGGLGYGFGCGYGYCRPLCWRRHWSYGFY